MNLNELFAGISVRHSLGKADIKGVTSDSRRVKDGYLFICQKGRRHDGHYHSSEALKNGAAAVLTEHPIEGIPPSLTVLTEDTRLAESVIWHNFTDRAAVGMTRIAITGTSGKTSVAYILRHILSAAGRKVGIITTVRALAGETEISLGRNGGSSVCDIHGAMTTPDPEYFFGAVAEMKKEGVDTLIYEASSQSLLAGKTSAIAPNVAIFTNLSPEHLDTHGDMESYFAAKALLLKDAEIAVVNVDDSWMVRLCDMANGTRVVRCSGKCDKVAESDVCALRYTPRGHDGSEFVYFSENAVFRIKTRLLGRHSMYNTLEAAACAITLGVDPMTVKESLATFDGVDGRLYRVDVKFPTVYIDYAHTPNSILAVGGAVRDVMTGKLIILFGCGGDRDRAKRPEMAKAAQSLADYVIITGDNPRSEDPNRIIDDILEGIDKTKPYEVIPNRREAIVRAINLAEDEDVVLLLGKGHEKYEILSDGKHPFDEEALVKEAAAHRNTKQA